MARALRELFKGQHEVTWLAERFARTTTDQDWMRELGQNGQWLVFTADRRIIRTHAELHAFRQAKLTGFFLSKGLAKCRVIKQLERILANWEQIETLSHKTSGGSLFELGMKTNHPKVLKG